MKGFPVYIQPDIMDCGPACLQMISAFHGKNYSLDTFRNYTFTGKDGVSLLGISKAAEKIGFRTIGGRLLIINYELAYCRYEINNVFLPSI